MSLRDYLEIRVQQYRFEKILHFLVEVLVGLKVEKFTATKLVELIEWMVSRETEWWPESAQPILDRFNELVDREPDYFGKALPSDLKSILSRGSEGSKLAPEWNLQVYGTADDYPCSATYIPRGSAVIVNVLESTNLYALTAGHILTDTIGVKEVKHFEVMWNSRAAYGPGKKLYPLEIIKNFSTEDESLDLAILRITALDEIPSDIGIELLSNLALKRCLTQGTCGNVFGWGQYDYDPNNPEVLGTPHMLRDVVVELAPNDHSLDPIFQCSSFDERGPCKGDSGGPLVVNTEDGVRLAGIVLGATIGGRRCHSHDFPTQFLAPSGVLDEILDAIREYEAKS